MDANTNIVVPMPAVCPVWDGIPAVLTALGWWVVWMLSPQAGRVKPSKVPYDAKNGQKASATDPDTWSDFENARAAYEAPPADAAKPLAGVGLALAAGGGFFAVDLDGCIDPVTGAIAPWAQAIIGELDTYTEFSPSGTGIHMFGHGVLPETGRKKDLFEVYSERRYMTVTGKRVPGTPDTIGDRTAEIARVHARIFSPVPQPIEQPAPHGGGGVAMGPDALVMNDDAVLSACLAGPNGERVRALLAGDITGYDNDHSRADLGLASLLAQYTDNARQIDRFFRGSRLMRAKWDETHGASTYGRATVQRALSDQTPGDSRRGQTGAPPASEAGSGGATPSAGAADEGWPAPVPIGEIDRRPFPLEALPPALADQCAEVAAKVQVAPDLPAMLGLGAVAAVSASVCVVKVGHAFTVTTNLYVVAVQPPSARKSATLKLMAAPVREADARLRAASNQEVAANRTRHALEEKQFTVLQKKLEKATSPDDTVAVMAEAADYAAAMTPPLPAQRLLVDDVTMEKLGQIIADQRNNTVAIFSAEGGVLTIMGGLYSKGTPNLDLVLKGYSGEAYNVDRLGREESSAPSPTITLALAVQPAVIQSMADDDAFRGRGVISRMIFSVPDSLVGTRLFRNEAVDPAVQSRYGRAIAAIAALPSRASPEDPGARHELLLDGEALDVWARYADAVERRMGEGGDLAVIEDWAGKLPGTVARIAGCLHLVEHAEGGAPWDVAISAATAAAAWAIGDYLIPHALSVYGMMGADRTRTLARRMLGWIKRLDLAVFSLRDWNRQHQDLRPGDVQRALDILQEMGYLRAIPPTRNGDVGRMPLPTYAVNPPWLAAQRPGPVA